jgi:hypothetical protein
MTILDMMAHLEDLYARRDLRQMEHKGAIDELIPTDIRARLAELDSEHEAEMEEIADAIKAAEEQVKAAVVEAGETVKGTRYQAVYGKGRVSWDNKGLEQYFKANDLDAMERYRKEGAPSVSIRLVKA